MSFTTVPTFTTGQSIGASDFNTYIRDDINYLNNGRQLVQQSWVKGSNATNATTTWNNVDATNGNARITVPATASGRVCVEVGFQGATSANTGQFRLSRDNGAEFSGDATNGDTCTNNTSASNIFIKAYFTGLTLATHTFDLQFRVNVTVATVTILATLTPIKMMAYEV